MTAFFECGPFSAIDGEGNVLYEKVNLSLQDGLCVSLEGPSGSGKSTLMRQVTALNPAPTVRRRLGEATYSGEELPNWRARVSLLHQDAPMIPGSVGQNISFPFDQRAVGDRKFDDEMASKYLCEVGLEHLSLDRNLRTLSGGERHRLALVRGLLWDPQVLVADEPLSGLDPESAAACFELLLRFAHRPGRLLLCALHHRELGEKSDRHMRLDDRRLKER